MKLTEKESRLFNKVLNSTKPFNEMVNRGVKSSFKRHHKDDADKWGESLKDLAHASRGGLGIGEGDFISDDDGETWYEVIEYSNHPEEVEDGRWETVDEWYVSPVDDFGNELTDDELIEKFPDYGESWARRRDHKGYATLWEYYADDEDYKSQEFLVVNTEGTSPEWADRNTRSIVRN